MKSQMVFKRYEMKYILSESQYNALKQTMKEHMQLDDYGKHNIFNTYFDTDEYLLIRRSIEKPCYKEKLRVRTYGKKAEKVFVEVKKKFKGIVYKRRLSLTKKQADDFLVKREKIENECQISREIDYFMEFYKGIKPKIDIDYMREAYFGIQDNDFRMTFDTEIKMREIETEKSEFVTSKDTVLLEIKTSMGIPSWLLDFLSENQIFKTSFSKYGNAYTQFVLPKIKGGTIDVA